MARVKQRGNEVGLREFLLSEAVEFQDMYIDMCADFEPALSGPVNTLTRGEAYSFSR